MDLSTWSVQYASATGTSWARTNLTGSIAPKSFYLVQEAAGRAGRRPCRPRRRPGPSPWPPGRWQGGAREQPDQRSGAAPTATSATGVVDFVGYGTANDFAGSGPAATPRRTPRRRSGRRARSPTPATTRPTSPWRTHAQGATGHRDPAARLRGRPPTTPPAMPGTEDHPGHPGQRVPLPRARQRRRPRRRASSPPSGRRAAAAASGSSSPPRTPPVLRPRPGSSSSPARTPAVGDSVLVTGRVSDFYTLSSGETVATTASLSITEITPTLVTARQQGQRAARAPRHHPGHRARRLRAAAPGRRHQRRDDHHRRPQPLDAGVLGGPRRHARHGQRRPGRRARASRSSARST